MLTFIKRCLRNTKLPKCLKLFLKLTNVTKDYTMSNEGIRGKEEKMTGQYVIPESTSDDKK